MLLGSLRSFAAINYHDYVGVSQITIAFDGRIFVLSIRHSIKRAMELRCQSVSTLGGVSRGGLEVDPSCGLTVLDSSSQIPTGYSEVKSLGRNSRPSTEMLF